MTVYPEGREWRCHGCGAAYPEDCEHVACQECGRLLMRVLTRLTLDATSHETSQKGTDDHM